MKHRFWEKFNFATEAQRRRDWNEFSTSVSLCLGGQFSVCKIKIRAAHEIMAARTTQLALLVDQLMPALQTKTPVLAGNAFRRRRGADGRNFSLTTFVHNIANQIYFFVWQ
jgi:hypothetical protein